jgi:hypothetical protein
MEKEQLKRIFEFLDEKENNNPPFKWKLINNEPFTKEELNIKGDLYLFDSKIASLPEGLKVGGYLNLGFCPNLTSLPKGLEVGEKLNLMYSKIESLPEGLKVGGYLNLSDCKKLTSLPKDLKVWGFLNITDSALTKYTDDELRDMVKPGFIKGKIHR